jgi:hypothetical protein
MLERLDGVHVESKPGAAHEITFTHRANCPGATVYTASLIFPGTCPPVS